MAARRMLRIRDVWFSERERWISFIFKQIATPPPPPPPSLKITLSTSSFMLGTTHEDGASPRLVDGHPPCVASSSSRQAKLV